MLINNVMKQTEWEAQRRSFAYGNAKIENDDITREIINEEADKMKIDTKYASGFMRRLAGSKAGALALAMDRLCYDLNVADGRASISEHMYVGKDGGCEWVAKVPDKPEYMDVERLLKEVRDELFAVALGQQSS